MAFLHCLRGVVWNEFWHFGTLFTWLAAGIFLLSAL
jgi:hypothetical protein